MIFIFIRMLYKKRTACEPRPFFKPGYWNQTPSVLLLQPSVDSTADNPHVLPLHKPPALATAEV